MGLMSEEMKMTDKKTCLIMSVKIKKITLQKPQNRELMEPQTQVDCGGGRQIMTDRAESSAGVIT